MALTSEVYFCKNTRLTPGSEDTYYFASESARSSFFIGKSTTDLHVSAMSYIREDRPLQVNIPLSKLEQCDYMMYKNAAYESKWFYAFITECKYINDSCTEVKFEVDPVQTWLSSLTLLNQFIERETTSSDTVNDTAYKQEEGLSTGTLYPYTRSAIDSGQSATKFLCFAMKRMFFTTSFQCYSSSANKIGIVQDANGFYSGITAGAQVMVSTAPLNISDADYLMTSYFYVLFPLVGSSSHKRLAEFMKMFNNIEDSNGAILFEPGDIAAIFNAPLNVLISSLQTLHSSHPYAPIILAPYDSLKPSPDSSTVYNSSYDDTRDVICGSSNGYGGGAYVDQPTTATSAMFDGYTPVNKRCLQSPFIEFRIQDGNGGGSEDLHPELFWDSDNSLHRLAIITKTFLYNTTVSRFYQIKYYDKRSDTDLTFEFPDVVHYTVGFDTTETWQALNGSYLQSQQQIKGFQNLISEAQNIVSGNIVGYAQGRINDISGDLSYKHTLAQGMTGSPRTLGNTSGNVLITNQATDKAYAVGYCAHKKYVEAADKYFTKYGYKVDRVGSVSFTSRTRFNFLKLRGLNASGSIPGKERQKLKQLFESGLRFWHGDYLGDYSVTNSIAT